MLFSQTSLHRTDDRNQTNIGLGIRHFTHDNAMLGANVFYDYDLSRSHSSAGFGVEYWRDYFRLGVNTYFGLSDWKDSRILMIIWKDPQMAGIFLLKDGYLLIRN